MTYCINPHCAKPVDPVNANNLICRNCGSEILLQGRYRVLKQLGQGGFGNTFEVDECGKTKVLKVLTENNSKAIELFQQEAKLLSQLNSEGIPKVEPDGYFTVLPKNSSVPLHCLAMEKIEGVNLEEWMEFRNYQRLSEAQALNWLKQLVEILALVHAHQYFHRDIKPQNIMLRPSGQLVLIDFGAVRQVTTTIVAGNSHTRIFSQGYSPPEQQNGYSVQQSDFFALGRTFIFLLTGKEPQDKEIYDPLTNELHWRKSALNIYPLLADLIDHLMAPTANQRPQNTQVILQKLNEIEKALQMPRILGQKTAIQSTNGSQSAASSSSVATVSVGGAKSVNASSSQTQKSQKLWQVLIGLGLGCFAVVIAAINQPNTKNPVSVSPVENVPVAIPSPVTQIPEIPLTVKSQPKISPSTLHTSDKVETEQAQIEEIEKQKLQAALKAEEERQAAIRKEAAVRTAREQLEAVIREKREIRQRREQLNADIRERERQNALIAQKMQQAEKQGEAKIQIEKAKAIAVKSDFENQASLPIGQNLQISAQATFPKGRTIKLEVARTQEQQMMGLMYRPALPDNRGMLFVFPSEQPVRFWMKNVPVPVDMVFLQNGVIKYIENAAPPCEYDDCPTYGPNTPVDQVIELRAGRASKLGLQVGDNVKIDQL